MAIKKIICAVGIICLLLLSACSPRDFLTRRLARDLIAASTTFNSPQQFWMRLGVVSNKDFTSPEYMVLQHHGWISASPAPCTGEAVHVAAQSAAAPCWNVLLTPVGVDTFRDLLPASGSDSNYFSIPTARRELIEVTGISKGGNIADADFTWKWSPMNEVGAALYSGDAEYSSMVTMKKYDDGWRLMEGTAAQTHQDMGSALKNAEPVH